MGGIVIWTLSLLGVLGIPLFLWACFRPAPTEPKREDYEEGFHGDVAYRMAHRSYQDGDDDGLGFVVVAVLLVLASGITWGVRGLVTAAHTSNRRTCAHRGVERDVETKFVYIGGAEYECLAKTDDGRWVPISQIDQTNHVELAKS